MIIYTIYKVTNKINNKVYIGFTSNYFARIKQHKKCLTQKTYKSKFHSAIRKYGWDNFHWEILYQSKDKEHCFDIEKYFILENKSYTKCGYNMSLGGEGNLGFTHSEKTKQIIGSRTKNTKLSEQHKIRIRNSHIGLKPSLETRKLMSRNRKGRNWYNNGIKNTQSHIHPGEGWIRGRI